MIEIIELKTPFGNVKIGDLINDENREKFWKKFNEIYPDIYGENAIIKSPTEEQSRQLSELNDKLRVVTEIRFWQHSSNKFEIMSGDEVVWEIVSNEYSVRSKNILNGNLPEAIRLMADYFEKTTYCL